MNEKKVYKNVINLLLKAKKQKDLTKLSKFVNSYDWKDDNRQLLLIGLISGASLKFNKKQAKIRIDEFKTL